MRLGWPGWCRKLLDGAWRQNRGVGDQPISHRKAEASRQCHRDADTTFPRNNSLATLLMNLGLGGQIIPNATALTQGKTWVTTPKVGAYELRRLDSSTLNMTRCRPAFGPRAAVART
jgi:hypothetical protein